MGIESQEELFDFYHNVVKRAYAYISAKNNLPVEVLFEIHAAFEHLSRITIYNTDEKESINRAYGHLKRSTFDIYKLVVKNHSAQWSELKKINIGLIDNGDFKSQFAHPPPRGNK